MISRAKSLSVEEGLPKYRSMLAGYPGVMPAPTAADGGTGTTATVSFSTVSGATLYQAISSPGSLTATGTTSPITVSGLTTGTPYTFQIQAQNAVGYGGLSAASNSVTPLVPGSFDSIATATPSGSGSVTFSSIPQTYKHLQLRISAVASGSGDPIYVQMNGNTSADYRIHYIMANGTGATSAGANIDAGWLGEYFQGSDTANPMVQIWDFQDYTATNRYKTVRVFSGVEANSSSSKVFFSSGLKELNAAITSLRVYMGSQTFSSGTSIALYGIAG